MPSPRKKMMFLAVPPVVTSGAHALTGSSPPLPPVPELLDEVEEDEDEDVEEDDVDELPPVDALEEEEESLEEEALAPPLPVPGSEEQPTQRHVAAMDTQAALNRVERASMGSISLKAAPFVPW
jgi:hypothetical protein